MKQPWALVGIAGLAGCSPYQNPTQGIGQLSPALHTEAEVRANEPTPSQQPNYSYRGFTSPYQAPQIRETVDAPRYEKDGTRFEIEGVCSYDDKGVSCFLQGKRNKSLERVVDQKLTEISSQKYGGYIPWSPGKQNRLLITKVVCADGKPPVLSYLQIEGMHNLGGFMVTNPTKPSKTSPFIMRNGAFVNLDTAGRKVDVLINKAIPPLGNATLPLSNGAEAQGGVLKVKLLDYQLRPMNSGEAGARGPNFEARVQVDGATPAALVSFWGVVPQDPNRSTFKNTSPPFFSVVKQQGNVYFINGSNIENNLTGIQVGAIENYTIRMKGVQL